MRTIGNTTMKIVNKEIQFIDTKINSKMIEPLKIDLTRYTKYGSFDIETALDTNNKYIPVSCGCCLPIPKAKQKARLGYSPNWG